MTVDQPDLLAIESVVDFVVGHTIRPEPNKPLDAEGLSNLHALSEAVLRLNGLPVPDDAYLDELIREMCEWHDLPLAENPMSR
jgi:hypothetical protein